MTRQSFANHQHTSRGVMYSRGVKLRGVISWRGVIVSPIFCGGVVCRSAFKNTKLFIRGNEQSYITPPIREGCFNVQLPFSYILSLRFYGGRGLLKNRGTFVSALCIFGLHFWSCSHGLWRGGPKIRSTFHSLAAIWMCQTQPAQKIDWQLDGELRTNM